MQRRRERGFAALASNARVCAEHARAPVALFQHLDEKAQTLSFKPKSVERVRVFAVLVLDVARLGERGEALVEPRLFKLIVHKDPVEPLVGCLVRCDAVENRKELRDAIEHIALLNELGVLHRKSEAADLCDREVWVGVAPEAFAEVFESVFGILCSAFSSGGVFGEVERDDRHVFPLKDLALVAGVGDPGEVVHVVGDIR